ncbi:hypothetical protein PANO111632_04075 [Paracoccus nototheniae]|uniref:Uncharacterized protein n=1 Tax=Paracoccus nototheniae TaxID=2489002 RepID=A0ABW4DWL8_9RHOB|nr:hypothetical protein [Paracoccus nototheniae]
MWPAFPLIGLDASGPMLSACMTGDRLDRGGGCATGAKAVPATLSTRINALPIRRAHKVRLPRDVPIRPVLDACHVPPAWLRTKSRRPSGSFTSRPSVQGVAPGWLNVVGLWLSIGSLIPVIPGHHRIRRCCQFVNLRDQPLPPVARAVRDWRIAEMRQDMETVRDRFPELSLSSWGDRDAAWRRCVPGKRN